jgi:UDP-N-acetylglucosamine--N-acetylmuramyl-(pentapeptide) pyrophosphoryl-undecaprenol N-acetylglucosamine transferase
MAILAVSGGGTGGHFFPALTVMQKAKEDTAFKEIFFFGDSQGIEYRLKENLSQVATPVFLQLEKFKGVSLARKLKFLTSLGKNIYQIHKVLKNQNFIALHFGGYTGVGLGLYSVFRKKPLFLHEQNSIPGATNRYLSKVAKRVFITFPQSEKFFPKQKVVLTGMPLRKEVKKAKNLSKEQIYKKLALERELFTLLVMGGSQGAKAINKLAVEIALLLKKEEIQIVHLTGAKNYDETLSMYRAAQVDLSRVKVIPFYLNMGEIYRIADFAISRSGASTAFELAYFGIPSLFIPFPYAIYNHQYHNAKYFVEKGGAYLMEEKFLDLNKVLFVLKNHLKDKSLHQQKREAMEKSYIPEAEEKILKNLFL